VVTESLVTIDRYIAQAEANLADLPANIYSKTLSDLLVFIAGKSRLLLKERIAA
jgi:hypothetical protein